MKLTPKNLASLVAIPNGSIIMKVDGDNFIKVTKADLTSIGVDSIGASITDAGGYYTSTEVEGALQEIGVQLGAGGGPVDGLDGVVFGLGSNMEYRANYNGATLASWGVGGSGARYDNVNKLFFISNTNSISVYNLKGLLQNTITTVGSGNFIKGSNATRYIFIKGTSQRIHIDTYIVSSIPGVILDVSPDGTSFTTISNPSGSAFTVASYDTITLAPIYSYTQGGAITGKTMYNVSGSGYSGMGCMISNDTIVIGLFIVSGAPGNNNVEIWKINIDTGIATGLTVGNIYAGAIFGIEYGISDGFAYYCGGESGGWNSFTNKINATIFTTPIGLLSSGPGAPECYVSKSSDGSISGGTKPGALSVITTLVLNQQEKVRNAFSSRSDSGQIALPY